MRFNIHLAFASVSLLSLATPALAQDPAPDDGVETSEIIVQARRKDESVQDVPISLQAVTGQQLQKLDIRQFEDVTKVVPGLALGKVGSQTSASLRGIFFDARASGSSTAVEFYRNDAVTTGSALFQAVYDIGQIEVLRGPQGTLRGRAAPSGSITVTTRRPDLNEVGANASGTLSDSHKWNINAAVNVPIIADKLAVRVAGFVGETRGNGIYGLSVPFNTIDRDIFENSKALRASVRADPFNGDLVLDFNYEAIRTSSRQFNQVESLSVFNGSIAPASQSPITIRPDDRLGVSSGPFDQDNNIKIYNWQAVARQWGQRLTYVGSKQNLSLIGYGFVGDPAGVLISPFAVTPPNFAPISVFADSSNTVVRQLTHELRIQNEERLFGIFDYVVGAFRSKGQSPTTIASRNTPTVTALVVPSTAVTAYRLDSFTYTGRGRYRSDQESSLFGNLTVHLGESTEISGGLRHIWFKADSGLLIGNFGTAAAPSSPYINGFDVPSIRRCFGNPSVVGCGPTKQASIYAASLKHNFTTDVMAYFSFGTSFRPGNSLVGYQGASPSPLILSYTNLADETSKSFEVGFKSSWMDQRLRFNASAFYQKFVNYPYLGSDVRAVINRAPAGSPADPALVNVFRFAAPVPVTVKGFEADLAFDVSRNFSLSATLAFADSKVTGGRAACTDLDNNDEQDSGVIDPVAYYNQVGANQVDTCSIAGRSASVLPRWSGTVQAEYSHPVGFGDAFVRGFWAWKGDSGGDALNPNDSVRAYSLVDLFAGIRSSNGAWELSGFVKNLFNTKRVLSRDASAQTTIANVVGVTGTQNLTYNYMNITTVQPREIGVSLRFAIGSR